MRKSVSTDGGRVKLKVSPTKKGKGKKIRNRLRTKGKAKATLEISRAEFDRLEAAGQPAAAPYALCLGYRIRYLLDLNAREAMHLIELRSGREGHPTYRAVAQAMHERIAAVHPAIAAAMTPRRLLARAAPGADHERDPDHRKKVAAEAGTEHSDAPPGVSALG